VFVVRSPFKGGSYGGTVERRVFIIIIFVVGTVAFWSS
jgi:hypothetical protein